MIILNIILAIIAFYILTGWEKAEKEMKKNKKTKSTRKQPYSEEEMNRYGLEEWQKELIRQGRFAPWDSKRKAQVIQD